MLESAGWYRLKQKKKEQPTVKKQCTEVEYLFGANKPEVCLVSLSSEQTP